MDLELKNLESYIGTTSYYKVFGVLVTDGVKYIMENGYSWFVTDAISVIITKLRNHDFLVVKLEVKNSTADLIISDGNNNILYKQHYKFTDAKRNLTLYYQNGVLMLASEY